jgi:hypothetical protein
MMKALHLMLAGLMAVSATSSFAAAQTAPQRGDHKMEPRPGDSKPIPITWKLCSRSADKCATFSDHLWRDDIEVTITVPAKGPDGNRARHLDTSAGATEARQPGIR